MGILKNALLIIDPQYDFCNPEGSLYVDGAEGDMRRLGDWIKKNKHNINHIVATADSHQVNNIAHPSFWEDINGKMPEPFTAITLEDIKEEKWIPRFYKEEAIGYIEALEKQGEFTHFIWPYHCLTGSRGAALDDQIFHAIADWTMDGNFYELVVKGTYPVSEHFGIFRSNVPNPEKPETLLNLPLINTLNKYENVFLAGEARSHCVANSLKQAMEQAGFLARKFVILEDCMSDVKGLEHLGNPIYEKARSAGIRFAKSTDIIL